MDREQVDGIIVDLVKGQAAIAATLGEVQKRIDDHFDGVNKRLDTLNGKVARHEQELHEQKVDTVNRMSEMVRNLGTVTTNCQHWSEQLKSLNAVSKSHSTYITDQRASKRATLKVASLAATLGAGFMGLLLKLPSFITALSHLIKG